MIQIDMEKPSACRWTDEENNIHLCPFLDREFDCLIQGHIGYWSWDGQYKDCPLREVTDTDTISRQAVLDAVDGLKKWSLLDKHGQHVGVGVFCNEIKTKVKDLPSSPTPSRPHKPKPHDISTETYYCKCGERINLIVDWTAKMLKRDWSAV